MKPLFSRVAVLGLGLLGGSLAWATRRRGVAAEVIGATRSDAARARALRDGAVDAVQDPGQAVAGAELVVLATPITAMPELLRRVAPRLADGAIVTDVGSVKGPLAEVLPGLLPAGARYVGSHPMAGSHERGMDAAQPDLFEGAPCIVCAPAGDADDARAGEADAARVAAFWQAVGCRVVRRDPARHDLEVAWMSHVPHALAFAFAAALADAPPGAREVAGPGFRDFTRIAHSDPELWADIFHANHKALAAPLQAARRAFEALCQAVEAGDAESVLRLLESARRALYPAPSGESAGEARDTKLGAPAEGPHAKGDRHSS
jgi:prephenate dehydrogenase